MDREVVAYKNNKKNLKKSLTKYNKLSIMINVSDGRRKDMKLWDLSSAGRASALQAEGHRFEPCRSHCKQKFTMKIEYGEIAQLARAHGSYPWCRGFKSLSRYE